MRYFFLSYVLLIAMVVGFAGFRGGKFSNTPIEIFDDMDHQAKVKAQATSKFFDDRAGARQPVAGTVPAGLDAPVSGDKLAADKGFETVGFSHGSDYYNSGRIGDFYGDGFPSQVIVDEALLRLGREKYDVNCAVCHGVSGNGKGFGPKFGIPPNVADFTAPRFLDPKDATYVSNGHLFETITKGKGTMGGYGHNTTVRDRWAIVAWIRTIGLSRTAPLSDPEIKQAYDAAKKS